MYQGQVVFAQLMQLLPRHQFNACVQRYGGQRRLRRLSCREQFLCMAFAQLTFRQSLRDVETCLRALGPRLYHAGIRQPVPRSTLADANARRDWRIYRDLAHVLIAQARRLYAHEPFAAALDRTVYALDATVIELCLSLFPWAHAQRDKAGIKVHTLLDLRGNIPCFMQVSSARQRDVAMLDHVPVEPGSIYVMDRDYNDFARLNHLHQAGALFVVRARRDLAVKRQRSQPVDRSTGLRSDQIVRLTDRRTARKYPQPLRRVSWRNDQTGRRFVFLTNDRTLAAATIVEVYRQRWQVELFFKWIKQHLRIERFMGHTSNAIHTQLWIAIASYVLLAIAKKQVACPYSLYEIQQIVSITLFEKVSLAQALTVPPPAADGLDAHNQLPLFNF